MTKTRLWWFENVEKRHVDFVVRREDHMEATQTTRGRRPPRKL